MAAEQQRRGSDFATSRGLLSVACAKPMVIVVLGLVSGILWFVDGLDLVWFAYRQLRLGRSGPVKVTLGSAGDPRSSAPVSGPHARQRFATVAAAEGYKAAVDGLELARGGQDNTAVLPRDSEKAGQTTHSVWGGVPVL